jgi:hypothetical protein
MTALTIGLLIGLVAGMCIGCMLCSAALPPSDD